MSNSQPPANRKGFRIAIVCALSREADAVLLLFDEHLDHKRYGRADGDNNLYYTGRIWEHYIVLTILPDIGNNSAAAGSASLRSSYTETKIGILVGVCGGTPCIDKYDAFLGDVVVSDSILQYDYGRQYPGQFIVKNKINETLGRPNSAIRSLLAKVTTAHERQRMQKEITMDLRYLQATPRTSRHQGDYRYPGVGNDKLYHPNYTHCHQKGCNTCSNVSSVSCDQAAEASCVELGCDPANTIVRKRYQNLDSGDFSPEIFIGRVGSGNAVMKSGEDRDRIAAEHELIAFEMEGAGAWEQLSCIVIKGICDYADSHKSKDWQDFAAATAASVAKAVLRRYDVHDGDRNPALQNDRRSVVKRRVAPSSEPARLVMIEDDAGERKWDIIMSRRMEAGACLNCGSSKHPDWKCEYVCGLYDSHTASHCWHAVRCTDCDGQGHLREDCRNARH